MSDNTPKSEPTYGHLTYGWRSRPSLEMLSTALKPLGIVVQEDPGMAGTDQYSFIFSKEPLTPDQLQTISEELWPE